MSAAAQADIFDYVVVGAGSAGCVLANRLSTDPGVRVALVEAGGKDDWIWFHIPVGYLFAIGNPRADWMFKTEAVPGLNGRSLAYPRGKVLGGCSAINAMIYMRGQAADYDGWRQMGLEGWGWDDVLPTFLAQEDHVAGSSLFHGAGGEWHVDHPRIRWALLDAVIDAAEQCGIPRTEDFNRGDNEGCGYFQVNQKGGRRWSAARAFLDPVRHRPNLTVITGALADRLVFEGTRATGVRLRAPGGIRTLAARREVVVATGAVATPALLERSGIGAGQRLRDLGVEVIADRPGVGENLQDHLQLRPIFKVTGVPTLNLLYQSLPRRAWMGLDYALRRRGPLTMAPSQLGAFTRSGPEYATPNLQFHIQPLSLDKFGDALHPFGAFTASVCNLRPTSRGSIHARSPDATDAPLIQPNYLATEEDRRVAVDSLRLARRIAQAPALAAFKPEEYKPGIHLQSDADIAQAAGDVGTTIFHPVGTARMGAPDDPHAVTDARLRVIGVQGLRVADASVMPRITSGNTASPTMMIADRAARMILEDAR
ncbi:GMC family oxidoreductase [Nitrospirillum viridazoti]|uniref:Choline dehydrogenase n=1 Tax=Nitrospirillum viridazoti CBAmc TaxID=1441467 RepID=A0A248JYR1_9PROT|nr:GMC family oxidoreductase N-terminal domain-containing protein [Nitrospirillum amazonense]ASG23699.1 choline dehydrogenase [Nitrospirillum amazonense CBAmc]TWB44911.1 choline dehydrogenase-like flavoprotein [Nitrospirillum amazonense]